MSISAGQIHFVPTADLCGNNAATFSYTASDGQGGTDTGTVTVDISCVNDVANAVDDSRTVAEDSGGTAMTVLANDSDPESDPLSVTGASDPANGATSFTAADVTYTPDLNFCGTDSFTYTITGGDSATVSVTVTCVNDAPVAVDDDRTTTEDTRCSDPVTGAGQPGGQRHRRGRRHPDRDRGQQPGRRHGGHRVGPDHLHPDREPVWQRRRHLRLHRLRRQRWHRHRAR